MSEELRETCLWCKQEADVGYPDGALAIHTNPVDGLICIQSGLQADTDLKGFHAQAADPEVGGRHEGLMAERTVQRAMRPRRPDMWPLENVDFNRSRMFP